MASAPPAQPERAPRPQRGQRRNGCALAVTLTLLDESRHRATGIDLSLGGIRLLTEQQIRPASYCAVRFMAAPDAPVMAIGHVIYSEAAGPQPGFHTGVQFINIDQASAAAIAHLVAQADTAMTTSTPTA